MFSPAEYKTPSTYLNLSFWLALYVIVFVLWLPLLSGFQYFSLLLFLLAIFTWCHGSEPRTTLTTIQLHNNRLLWQSSESLLPVETHKALHCSTWLLIVDLGMGNQKTRLFIWRWLCTDKHYRRFYLFLKQQHDVNGV